MAKPVRENPLEFFSHPFFVDAAGIYQKSKKKTEYKFGWMLNDHESQCKARSCRRWEKFFNAAHWKASVGNVQHFAMMEKFQKLFHLQRRLAISNIHVKLLHAIDFFLHKSHSRRIPAAASAAMRAPEWVENLSHSAVSSLALRNEIYEFSTLAPLIVFMQNFFSL